MTVFAVTRFDLVRALGAAAQLAPALDTDITLSPLADDLIVATVGRTTAAACRVPIVPSDWDDGEREVIAIPGDVAKKVLAAHKPPRGKEARAFWMSQEFRVEMASGEITIEQVDPLEIAGGDVSLTAHTQDATPVGFSPRTFRPPIQDSDSQLIPGATPGLIAALTALSKFYAHPQLELCADGWAVRLSTPLAVAVSMLSRLEPGEGLSEQLLEEAGRAVLDVDAAPAAAVS